MIESLLGLDFTLTLIAKKLGRHVSTISREVKRHSTGKYSPWASQIDADTKKGNCGRKRVLDRLSLRSLIVDKLILGWSPEQISGRLKLEGINLSHEAILYSLKEFKAKTLTFDNGLEFAGHEYIGKELNTNIYFCHPYSSYEKGTNENTNGLLRRYLPKRKSFSGLESK